MLGWSRREIDLSNLTNHLAGFTARGAAGSGEACDDLPDARFLLGRERLLGVAGHYAATLVLAEHRGARRMSLRMSISASVANSSNSAMKHFTRKSKGSGSRIYAAACAEATGGVAIKSSALTLILRRFASSSTSRWRCAGMTSRSHQPCTVVCER